MSLKDVSRTDVSEGSTGAKLHTTVTDVLLTPGNGGFKIALHGIKCFPIYHVRDKFVKNGVLPKVRSGAYHL